MRRLIEIKRKCAQFLLTRAGDAKHKINLFRPYGTLSKVRMGEETDCHLISNNKAQYIQRAHRADTLELHVVETAVSLLRLLFGTFF